MVANKTFVYKGVPDGHPVPGKDIDVESLEFDLDTVPKGGLVVRVLEASLDPYLREMMRDPEIPLFVPALLPNQPIANFTVSQVLKSDHPEYKVGDLVMAMTTVSEFAVVADFKAQLAQKITNPHNLDLGMFLGPLGMPGMTAYVGLYKLGKPQKGETLFVNAASGAVGQLVGQFGLREGMRVIGSVGSDEKLDYITKELGFHGGFNYKKEPPKDGLARLAPEGVDVYFEGVGGEHLEATLDAMNDFGRIVACGMLSQINNGKGDEPYGIPNIDQIICRNLTMQGFIIINPKFWDTYFAEQQETMQKLLVDGSIKAKLSVSEGIEKAADVFAGLLRGSNMGKAVLKISSL